MIAYYVVCIAGILLCILTLKLPKVYKANFALSILSVIAGGYLIEIYLFYFAPQPDLFYLHAQAAESANVPFDDRTRYQVFEDLRRENVQVYPGMNVSQIAGLKGIEVSGEPLLPLAGISEVLTIHCNESGEYTFYVADKNGFNNSSELYPKSDIVLVGDSFAHGNCVLAGEDIAGQLRKRQIKAINLGYSGNGPLIELATLREYAAPLKPKIVLWLYYEGNDLEDLLVEAQSPPFRAYLQRDFSQHLLNRQHEINQALIEYIEKRAEELEEKDLRDAGVFDTQIARIARFQQVRQRFKFLSPSRQSPTPPLPLFEEILQEARDLTISMDGKFYFVYLPGWSRYAAEANEDDLFYRDQVLAIVRSLDIPVIDMHEIFVQHPDPLSLFPFRIEGHYTAEGYELVASTIHSYLNLSLGDAGDWNR